MLLCTTISDRNGVVCSSAITSITSSIVSVVVSGSGVGGVFFLYRSRYRTETTAAAADDDSYFFCYWPSLEIYLIIIITIIISVVSAS